MKNPSDQEIAEMRERIKQHNDNWDPDNLPESQEQLIDDLEAAGAPAELITKTATVTRSEGTMTDTPPACTEHTQLYCDDSLRGQHYHDDRTVLAHVYDGLSQLAILTDKGEVERYQEETDFYVSLTPAGECQIEGKCRVQEVSK